MAASMKLGEMSSSERRVWDWPLQREDGVVHVHNDAHRFQVGLEVRLFSPREIDVKVCGMELVIQCQHEERGGKVGSIRREIHRTYHLPHDVDLSTLKSHLTPQGILHIAAAKLPSAAVPNPVAPDPASEPQSHSSQPLS